MMAKLLCAGMFAASATLVGSAAIAATAPESKACFFTQQIDGWHYVNDHMIRIEVGAARQFDLTLMASAPELVNHLAIGFKSPDPTGLVCTGDGAGVEVFKQGPYHETYAVTHIDPVPPKPASDQPKL
jgi:hypothetical protein